MTEVVVAYIPVLHEGYRRFIETHAADAALFVVGHGLYQDYRPLAKDIRSLDPELIAKSISAWEVCESVGVLDEDEAQRLSAAGVSILLPAEDVSYQLVERYFPRNPVKYDGVFLRWDKSKTVQLIPPRFVREVDVDAALSELAIAAESIGQESIDWWRRVGAAMRLANGEILTAMNAHSLHPLSAYAAGDPRSNFFKGVHLEISTAEHAEARIIAQAAHDGESTAGATLYVTDFPCPPCARLIARAGVKTLYFREGYAVLDGNEVLEAADVEIVQVST